MKQKHPGIFFPSIFLVASLPDKADIGRNVHFRVFFIMRRMRFLRIHGIYTEPDDENCCGIRGEQHKDRVLEIRTKIDGIFWGKGVVTNIFPKKIVSLYDTIAIFS